MQMSAAVPKLLENDFLILESRLESCMEQHVEEKYICVWLHSDIIIMHRKPLKKE